MTILVVKVADTNPSVELGKTRKIEFDGATLYLTVNFSAGQLTSVLIKSEKMGSTLRGFLHVVAVLINELLNAGIDWEHISKTLMFHRFEPLSGKCPSIVHEVVVSVTELLQDGS
jgi:hypothetical protein